MKKVIALVTALAAAFTLCACSSFSYDETKSPVPRFALTLSYSYADRMLETDGETYYSQSLGTVHVRATSERTAENINTALEPMYKQFEDDAGYVNKVAADQLAGEAIELSYTVSPSAPRCDTGVLSLVFDVSENFGGVHPDVTRYSRCFSADSGEELSLDDLGGDAEQLRAFLKNYIVGLTAGDDYKGENGISFLFDDAEYTIGAIIDRGEQWYFGETGLVVYADPYDVAPYAAGTLCFEVPYAALEEFIDEDYLPVEHVGENGMVLADAGEKLDRSTLSVLDTVTVDEDMQSVILSAEETVYDVVVYSPQRVLWQRNYLTTSEGVEVISSIPDVVPNIAVRYKLADGTLIERGIFQSGKDGSILLTEIGEEFFNMGF